MTKRQELEKRLAEITAELQAEIERENKRPWPLGPWHDYGSAGIRQITTGWVIACVSNEESRRLIVKAPDLYEKLNDIALELNQYGSVDYQSIAGAQALLDSVLNGE